MSMPLPELLNQLELSGHQFLATFEGIPEDAWRRKPSSGGWSMEEVAEHVAIVEAQVRKLILERMLLAPAQPDVLAASVGGEEVIDRWMADPAGRQAPELALPKGRWATPAEVAQSFRDNRQRILDFLRTTVVDVDAHAWVHPGFGPLTLRQWLYAQVRHVERHTAQIRHLLDAPP